MKRKSYSEKKIILILKEHEAGIPVPELARRYEITENTENTIYRWKSKFGGMEVSDAKKLRELEQENVRLKRLLAEAKLDKAAMKEVIEGKWLPARSDVAPSSPLRRRASVSGGHVAL